MQETTATARAYHQQITSAKALTGILYAPNITLWTDPLTLANETVATLEFLTHSCQNILSLYEAFWNKLPS